MASLEALGARARVAPSVKMQGDPPLRRPRRRRQHHRHRSAARAQGLRARHSRCARARSPSLYRATNAIILGDRLAEKIGARIGANITVQTSEGARINAQVVGFFHSGVRSIDEGTAYVLVQDRRRSSPSRPAWSTNCGCGSPIR